MDRYFGRFGGMYAPETLMPALLEIEKEFVRLIEDENFKSEYEFYLKNYVGRPSPLYWAKNLSKHLGVKIYLKREDLNHTGAHKINNCIGQALLAKHMGKKDSLPKQVQVNTVLQQLQLQHFLAWNVRYSWAKRMQKGSIIMCRE